MSENDDIKALREELADWVVASQPLRIARILDRLEAAEAEVQRLKQRLEVDDSHPIDGIEARDTTIRLLGAEVQRLTAERDAFKAECDTLRHQVITCGVAATHPDPNLTRTGAYADKWNSAQAEAVRVLRAERDALRRDAERYRWLRMADWWESPVCAIRNPKEQAKPGSDCPSRARLDETIDTAMQAEKGCGNG